jgi:uncharacterized protein (AIM24 family)
MSYDPNQPPPQAPPPQQYGAPPPQQQYAAPPPQQQGAPPQQQGAPAAMAPELAQFAPKPPGDRFTLQNGKLLRVSLGPDVLSAKGAMVAYQGQVEFDHQGSGMKGFMKKALTGEGMSLMRVRGQGDVYFAVGAADVIILRLNGDALTVNGANVLAFDADSIQHDIKMVQGAGGFAAGGMFNVYLQGQGQVAIITRGTPVVLWAHQAPTFVDTDAVVGRSANLQTVLQKSFNAKAFIGKGSGEAFQMGFQGQGWVLVQPAETPSAGVLG